MFGLAGSPPESPKSPQSDYEVKEVKDTLFSRNVAPPKKILKQEFKTISSQGDNELTEKLAKAEQERDELRQRLEEISDNLASMNGKLTAGNKEKEEAMAELET